MLVLFEEFVNSLQGKAIKFYLILANFVLVIFAIWFANVGLLPFAKTGDFLFFAVLSLILAIYRPGWTFVLFVGALALENINLAPKSFGLAIRPYQFFGAITIVSLIVQIVTKRLPFDLPKFKWYDALPLIFALSGFLSSLGAANKSLSFKQSIIATTFVALYFLTRVYIQSLADLKRVVPFFLSSTLVVSIYGIWQNVRFLHGGNSFEVMPGRPNATFTEPDWFGIYLAFLISLVFAMIYYFNKDKYSKGLGIFNFQIPPHWDKPGAKIFNKFSIIQFLNYTFLVLIFVTLILTVSRSAWIGAVFVAVVFLKSVLISRYPEQTQAAASKWERFVFLLKMNHWQWKEAGKQLLFILIALAISFGISTSLTRFQLVSRAQSTGGLQKITIVCSTELSSEASELSSGSVIQDINELTQFGCRHINLEDIEKEKAAGNVVTEVYRPDPNVNIRSEIYKKSIAQIKAHPIFGIGWGSISAILGIDERGAGLNASNIFLEVWLGAGLIGFLAFSILLLYILIRGIILFLDVRMESRMIASFVFLGWAAIVIPNLFNSGIFLGFVWVYLAVAAGLLVEEK